MRGPGGVPPCTVVGVLRTLRAGALRRSVVSVPQDEQAPRGPLDGTAVQVADVIGEIAAAMAYLETLAVRLHAAHEPGDHGAAAIPPSTLIALRRSCQRVERHSHLALVALSPRRAAAVRSAAAQIREVEALRFGGRAR